MSKSNLFVGCQWLVHGARDSHWDNSEISSCKYVMGNVVSFYSKCAHDCPMLIFCTLLRLHCTETMWPHSIAMGEYVVEGIIVETCAKTLVSTHFSVILQSVECICWIGVHLPLYTSHGFTQYIIIIVLYLVCLLCFYFLDFLVLGAAEETRTVVTWNLWMRCFPACRLAFKRLVTAFAASSIKPALAKLLKKEVTYLGSQKRLSRTSSNSSNRNPVAPIRTAHDAEKASTSVIYIYIIL